MRWEYLQVTLHDEREPAGEGPPFKDWQATTYALISLPDGKRTRVDLWVWLEEAKQHKVFHKTVIQLLSELGADGWELVSTHFTWAQLFATAQQPKNQAFYFKRPSD